MVLPTRLPAVGVYLRDWAPPRRVHPGGLAAGFGGGSYLGARVAVATSGLRLRGAFAGVLPGTALPLAGRT